MEFLNGIAEKLAPIHEKILDLTNPLTLTIEAYIPQLASFHDQLIYVLILAVILLFGLLRKGPLRLTRARPPRRVGPEMRMSRSSAPSTPTSLPPKFKSVVHGRVLDYGSQGYGAQPMGSAVAFGAAQQSPAAAQGYGAQGFAPQPMGAASAFGAAQQPPAAAQGYGAQGFAPQPMGAAAFGAAQQPPAAPQGYGAQGFVSQPMESAAAFGAAQQPAAEQGYSAQPQAEASASDARAQQPAAAQGYSAQPQAEAPASDARAQQPAAAEQSYPAQPDTAPQEDPAFDAGAQQPAAAQGDAIPKMGTPVFDFNSFAQQPAAEQSYPAQPDTDAVPQAEAPAFDAGAQQPAAAEQSYPAQPDTDAVPQAETPAFDAGAQQPAAAQGDAIPKMGTPVFDFNSFAQQPAANPDHAAQNHVTPQADSDSSEPIASDATPFVPERQAEVPDADVPHAAEEEPQAKEEEGPSASWKEPDAPTAEERLARLYPNVESEFQNLYINLYADQELTTDFSDLRNSVSQRILQNQSPLPLFDPGQGDTRDLLLAHIANSARDVIEKLSEDRQGDRPKFNLHEQELHKIYRCILYRLNDSGLIDEETIKRLVQEARDLTSNR